MTVHNIWDYNTSPPAGVLEWPWIWVGLVLSYRWAAGRAHSHFNHQMKACWAVSCMVKPAPHLPYSLSQAVLWNQVTAMQPSWRPRVGWVHLSKQHVFIFACILRFPTCLDFCLSSFFKFLLTWAILFLAFWFYNCTLWIPACLLSEGISKDLPFLGWLTWEGCCWPLLCTSEISPPGWGGREWLCVAVGHWIPVWQRNSWDGLKGDLNILWQKESFLS